ncbi:hypothetical protein SETIT_7G299300v2 [Setaria italica]|uniref:Uncharacterized protein n=1 Tax=Setaria italica TaxID=4555 RepID=A0A368S1I6_SETIT|nr:hypothetical protein SETIT_7G299300v2 [Setaria italica]
MPSSAVWPEPPLLTPATSAFGRATRAKPSASIGKMGEATTRRPPSPQARALKVIAAASASACPNLWHDGIRTRVAAVGASRMENMRGKLMAAPLRPADSSPPSSLTANSTDCLLRN